jgi:hypothetical protein
MKLEGSRVQIHKGLTYADHTMCQKCVEPTHHITNVPQHNMYTLDSSVDVMIVLASYVSLLW